MSFHKKDTQETNFWISYTDLVTGFLIVFILFVLVLLANRAPDDPTPPPPPPPYGGKYIEMVEAFQAKFKDHPHLRITDDGTIRFIDENGVLFQHKKWDLTPQFEKLLASFVPEYLREVEKLIQSDTSYKIKEIRVEGYASSVGDYYFNLKLSNLRAYEVMKYIQRSDFMKAKPESFQQYIRKNMISCGYSNTRFLDQNGNLTEDISQEDQAKSRRVELRTILEKINTNETNENQGSQ